MQLNIIEQRARRVCGISQLLPMQQQMANISLPARILLQAPTGSGKTLAFAIALLRTMPANADKNKTVKGLVLAPTRELTLQIYDIIRQLAAPELKTTALYGGHSFETEANSLAAGADIVVGTPGRVLDHINRRRLDISDLKTLVIDEYDKSLELGFEDDMKRITAHCRKASSLILTSATAGVVPQFIGNIEHTLNYTDNTNSTVPEIEQFIVTSPAADKLQTLGQLLDALGSRRSIVFVNHRDAAERVADFLEKRKCRVALYHGGLEQNDREKALILFENGTDNVLVSTDLASRGLDIAGVDAVIHYHLAPTVESHTHRNGRTARMGAQGSVYAIISANDKVPQYVTGSSIEPDNIEPAQQNGEPMETLFFNAGKRDKISKGDIAGFLIKRGGLSPDAIGRIDIKDRCAYAAVPASVARETAVAVAPYKLKNTRVRVSRLKKR